MIEQETCPCRLCTKPTPMLGTKLCDRCWELERRIECDRELALKILGTKTLFARIFYWGGEKVVPAATIRSVQSVEFFLDASV
jgi:hypothetical protein